MNGVVPLRAFALVVCLVHLPLAHALDVRVDATDGPLELTEWVDTALADWRAAGVDPDLVERSVRVRYGDADLFGTDAIVFTVARPDDDVDYELVVNPVAEGVRAALIPALGVVLGGVLGEGALEPRVQPGLPRTPVAADAEAIVARRSGVEGDIDGDGLVTFEDLLRVAAAYGRQGVNLSEDLDGDGIVGDGDLEVLRTHYVFTDPDVPGVDPEADPDAGAVDEATDPVAPGDEPDEAADAEPDEPEPEDPDGEEP
jgi:hypothetical protein